MMLLLRFRFPKLVHLGQELLRFTLTVADTGSFPLSSALLRVVPGWAAAGIGAHDRWRVGGSFFGGIWTPEPH